MHILLNTEKYKIKLKERLKSILKIYSFSQLISFKFIEWSVQ